MTEEVTRDEIDALRIRLSHAVVTATNDDLSPPLTEKRDRHVARLEAMRDVIDMLAALTASQSRPTKGADITRAREQIVEECARVAERYNDGVGLATARGIADAIRALSPAPAQTGE